MKRLHLIEAAGVLLGVLVGAIPCQAIEIAQADGFYQFASKTAELYRGQLFSKPEVSQFVNQVTRLTGGATEPVALLNALKNNPYNATVAEQALRWLESECNYRKTLSKATVAKLQALKLRLEKHCEMLTQVSATYEG